MTGKVGADDFRLCPACGALPCDWTNDPNPGALIAERDALLAERDTPAVVEFAKAVQLEAWHQRARWPSEHDSGKTPFDWFWLVGYLAQKAASAQVAGDTDKALHHTISTAAALANWHLAISGVDTSMRPGIEVPDDWTCQPCEAVNYGIRNVCRFCKQPRPAIAQPKASQ